MTSRSSSFRRWLRASTLVVAACVGSALLFHDSETSAWDTAGDDINHDTTSHGISGWLRDKNNGGHRWHDITTELETCYQVLNESSGNQRNDDFPHEVDIPNNFRVQDCIDHYVCDFGEVEYRRSTWRENHRHSTTGTGNPGAHDPNYKKSLNGTEYSSSATLTCGGGEDDDDDDDDNRRIRRVCDGNTDRPGTEVWLSPGETWLGVGGVREAECFNNCDASTPSGAVVTRGDLGEHGEWVGTNQQSGSRWRVTWNGHGGAFGCPGYKVSGTIEEMYPLGSSAVIHRSLLDGYNIYPEHYPHEGNHKQNLLAFTGLSNLTRPVMPLVSQQDVTSEGITLGSARSLWANHAGALRVRRGTTYPTGFQIKLYEAGMGRIYNSVAFSHPVYEHRIAKYGSATRAHTFMSRSVSRNIYTINACHEATWTDYRVSPPRVETTYACSGRNTTATGPWHCPASGTLVRQSRALWSIPAEIGDAYDAVAADPTATAEQQVAAAWRLYDYCRGFTPVVTIEVPDDEYRITNLRNADPIPVTFAKQNPQPAANTSCDVDMDASVTRTYVPGEKTGDAADAAVPVEQRGGLVSRTDANGNPVAPPTLHGACVYDVNYPSSAADGDLRLVQPVDDPATDAREDQVSADAPETEATYEEAFFDPQVTINIPDGHVGGRSSGEALFPNVKFRPVRGSHSDCVLKRAPLFYAHDIGDRTRPGGALPKLDRRCVYDVDYPDTNSARGDESTLTLVTPVDDPDTAEREDQVAADDPDTTWDERATEATYEGCAAPNGFWSDEVGVSLAFADAKPLSVLWWDSERYLHPRIAGHWVDRSERSDAFARLPASATFDWAAVDAGFDWGSDPANCERALERTWITHELPPDNARVSIAGAPDVDD